MRGSVEIPDWMLLISPKDGPKKSLALKYLKLIRKKFELKK